MPKMSTTATVFMDAAKTVKDVRKIEPKTLALYKTLNKGKNRVQHVTDAYSKGYASKFGLKTAPARNLDGTVKHLKPKLSAEHGISFIDNVLMNKGMSMDAKNKALEQYLINSLTKRRVTKVTPNRVLDTQAIMNLK